MLKIFFSTFFIAELIIATAVILKIRQFDKYVIELNNGLIKNKVKIKYALIDLREILEEFHNNIRQAKDYIVQKRNEYSIKALKTSLIYLSIFLLKGKYKKTIFAYQVIKEIYDGFKDVEF